MPRSIQLAVVGAGPGGYTAAFLAADLGMKVMLIDEEPNPGGVCVYRGCIPSKALLHVAKVVADARDARAWGVEFGEPRIDLDRLRAWKSKVVERLTGGAGQLGRARKVEYVQGLAEIVDPRTLLVRPKGGAEERVTFEHAILATGSYPVRPKALALESARVLDSTTALDLANVPASLLVVGGGYIGLELGTVYAALGSQVTVVEMTAGLLPGVDRDLVTILSRRIGKMCKAVHLQTRVVALADAPDGVKVTLEGPMVQQPEQIFDAVLVAVGRAPRSAIPGLNRTTIGLDARGFVKVDPQRRTSEPTIFAIGDVAGEPMLAHKAFYEGRVAVEVIAGHKVAYEPLAIPAVVFTDPEVAWCGLTETQAAQDQRAVEIVRFPWGASGRALTLDRPEGVTKLVIDPETERILGVGIAGVGAGELIAEGVVAIEMGALASDLKLCIHPHPTLSETMMESAEVFFGQATHVYRPRTKTTKE